MVVSMIDTDIFVNAKYEKKQHKTKYVHSSIYGLIIDSYCNICSSLHFFSLSSDFVFGCSWHNFTPKQAFKSHQNTSHFLLK